MGKIEQLAAAYERHISVPWPHSLPGAQRVVMLVYDKELERSLRAKLGELEQATLRAGHGWRLVDCTRWFAEWLGNDEYRDAYFEEPNLLTIKLNGESKPSATRKLETALTESDENTVVALLGVGSLYGFLRASELILLVEQAIQGRLLVLFPGTKDGNNYRLLDARDGWNYLAQPITLHDEEWMP